MHSSKSVVSENCAACSKTLMKKEYLRCVTCKSAFDILCLNITSQRFRSFYSAGSEAKLNWKCPECICRVPKQGNLNTPVRVNPQIGTESTAIIVSPLADTQNVTMRNKPITPSSDMSILNSSAAVEIENSPKSNTYVQAFTEELRAMRLELSRMCDKITNFTETVNARMDRLEDRMTSIENKKSELENSKLRELEETVLQLEIRIQERDQEALGNDLEIASFPEDKNENSTHVILTVAKKLGVELEERDVVIAHRVGSIPAPVEGGAHSRPRPLIARLARRVTRDALLRAARVRRRVTTEGMALQQQGSPRAFYVNERLTKPNRHLFQKAREAGRRTGWKFVWTREGKIFARKEQGKASVRVRCDNDIIKVFGHSSVSSDKSSVQ